MKKDKMRVGIWFRFPWYKHNIGIRITVLNFGLYSFSWELTGKSYDVY